MKEYPDGHPKSSEFKAFMSDFLTNSQVPSEVILAGYAVLCEMYEGAKSEAERKNKIDNFLRFLNDMENVAKEKSSEGLAKFNGATEQMQNEPLEFEAPAEKKEETPKCKTPLRDQHIADLVIDINKEQDVNEFIASLG